MPSAGVAAAAVPVSGKGSEPVSESGVGGEKSCCNFDLLKTWVAPLAAEGVFVSGLCVNNSMAGAKVPFVPRAGKRVTWYGCGPTVYDSAHMGHARNYVTFDVLRRVMEDYFGYDVRMCMNVTDIDDKIIARASEQKMSFDQLARFWENDFWRKLRSLNCRMPDIITRVSEYIPEILQFIAKIIENKFAYESGGSVYFDTSAFRASSKHRYGRMEPWSVNDEARVLEGEGALGVVGDKRCVLDFALWKKAKPGEPSWESKWGPGRPGWHIECSVMASDALGFPIDIHSGGIDLRFPHHDNELAQTEACFDKPQWVNYFLHSGHLHIHGLKMAKSLKNFITIDAILEKFDWRIVRLMVLIHKWDQPMNYNPDGESMREPEEVHRTFVNFFATVKSLHRKCGAFEETWKTTEDAAGFASLGNCIAGKQRFDENDLGLQLKLDRATDKVHSALCDNFDTATAITQLQALISEVFVYLKKQPVAAYKGTLLAKVAAYIHRILTCFGMCQSSEDIFEYSSTATLTNDGGEGTSGGAGAGGGKNADQRVGQLMDILGDLRQEVRTLSRGLMKKSATPEDGKKAAQQLLETCDQIRDSKLTPLKIRLEDHADGSFIWKEM